MSSDRVPDGSLYRVADARTDALYKSSFNYSPGKLLYVDRTFDLHDLGYHFT